MLALIVGRHLKYIGDLFEPFFARDARVKSIAVPRLALAYKRLR